MIDQGLASVFFESAVDFGTSNLELFEDKFIVSSAFFEC